MKPHRTRMAHNLLLNYGLHKKLEVRRACGRAAGTCSIPTLICVARGVPRSRASILLASFLFLRASPEQIVRPTMCNDDEMTKFHSDDYVEFLKTITPDNQHDHMRCGLAWGRLSRLWELRG